MSIRGYLSAFFFGAVALASSAPVRPVGVWHYDTGTLRLELSKKSKDELNGAGEQGKKILTDMKASLMRLLDPPRLEFKRDKSFVIGDGKKTTTGHWSQKGLAIFVKMDKPGQTTPAMKLSADGKRIATKYESPGFLVGYIDLVRSK